MLLAVALTALWFELGLLGALYWPLKYAHNMKAEFWQEWAKQLPWMILFGPFSFFASIPM